MRPLSYVLEEDGRTPRPVTTAEELIGHMRRQMEMEARGVHVVGRDFVGPVKVSTVFLGEDMSVGLGDLPLLWETAIFCGDGVELVDRYASWEEADAGHRGTVAKLRRSREQGGGR